MWRIPMRSRLLITFTCALGLLAAACSESSSATAGASALPEASDTQDLSNVRREVRWFVGLGTGTDGGQIDRQEAVVDAFNDSQSDIELVLEVVDNSVSTEVLATQIAAGNPPDIIGPVGLAGSNAFAGQYLDLTSLIADNDAYRSLQSAVADMDTTEDGVLGIPFASFPSALYYNTELFDEAGLPYPPSTFDEDGTSLYGEGTEFERPWDWTALAELAEILTVDSLGNDARSDAFDADQIVQFGFTHQWTSSPASVGTSFSAGSIVAEDGTAQVPDAWIESLTWYHDLIHEAHAAPNQAQRGSELLANNEFNSGNVAMASTHLWYICCISDLDDAWNVAALPTFNGEQVSKIHTDSFRVHVDSDVSEEALVALEFLFSGAAAEELLDVYGGLPSQDALRSGYFDDLDEQFPQDVNWEIFLAGLEYSDVPNHEQNMPNFLEATTRLNELERPLHENPDLNIDTAIADLERDLNEIFGG